MSETSRPLEKGHSLGQDGTLNDDVSSGDDVEGLRPDSRVHVDGGSEVTVGDEGPTLVEVRLTVGSMAVSGAGEWGREKDPGWESGGVRRVETPSTPSRPQCPVSRSKETLPHSTPDTLDRSVRQCRSWCPDTPDTSFLPPSLECRPSHSTRDPSGPRITSLGIALPVKRAKEVVGRQ